MRDLFHVRPFRWLGFATERFSHRPVTHHGHVLSGDEQRLRHEYFDRVAASTFSGSVVQLLDVIRRQQWAAVINDEGWLVHRQLLDLIR